MKKFNKKSVRKAILNLGLVALYTATLGIMHVRSIDEVKSAHHKEIKVLENKIKDSEIYKDLHEEDSKKIIDLQKQLEEAKNKLNYIETQVKLSKEEDAKYNQTNFANKDLKKYPLYTVDEMNKWISDRAPENSAFIGKGEEFLEVSKETNLDPRYLVAHAALESAWGTSTIAKDKNNYFGIAAYNNSPYSSALSFDSSKSGIEEGAKWIKTHYIDEGQDTLNKMQFGKKTYCTLDDGTTPDQSWIDKIVAIIY